MRIEMLRNGMMIIILCAVSLLSGCIVPKDVHFVEVAAGCPLVPSTVFEKMGVDAKLGASTFGKVLTGDSSLVLTPDVVSFVSQAVADAQVQEAYICAAGKRGELVTPEQFAHTRQVVAFYSTKPTPEQASKFHKEFPFPATPTKSEIMSQATEQLASEKIEDRLVGVHALNKMGITSQEDAPVVIEILSKFVRGQAGSRKGLQATDVPFDVQAAMSALASKELKVSLSKATLTNPLDLKGTYLPGLKLEGGDLAGASLSGIHWEKSILKSVNLHKVNLEYAHLEEADLSHADLQGASLLSANLDMADFHGANLQAVNFHGAQLKGAILEEADLSDANFREARIDGARWKGARICRTRGISETALASMQGINRC